MDSTTDADASPATDLAIRRVALDSLYVDPANARAHGAGNMQAIAASLARFCAGLELDPRYVDVIVRRWEQATGGEALLDGDGRSFSEVAEDRGGAS